jgi:hypothetical protein
MSFQLTMGPVKSLVWAAVERADVEIRALIMDADDKKSLLKDLAAAWSLIERRDLLSTKACIRFLDELRSPGPYASLAEQTAEKLLESALTTTGTPPAQNEALSNSVPDIILTST